MLTEGKVLSAARNLLLSCKNLVILTGAGVSAASGIPTFRGAGGLWRQYRSEELATPQAFKANPSRVWEFYSWRRELVRKCQPNPAHTAIAHLQSHPTANMKSPTILITQNVDGLHLLAGSNPVIEMHGSLYRVRCTNHACPESKVNVENRDSPIVPALQGKGAPDGNDAGYVPVSELPHCKSCQSLLRPSVVWFGEELDAQVLTKARMALTECDLLFVIGTAGAVYPAAGFAEEVMRHGGNVVEFNLDRSRLDEMPKGNRGGYLFVEGPCEKTVPEVIGGI